MNRIRIIHGMQDPDITKNDYPKRPPTQDFVNFNFILNFSPFFYKNNQVTRIFFAMEKKYRV